MDPHKTLLIADRGGAVTDVVIEYLPQTSSWRGIAADTQTSLDNQLVSQGVDVVLLGHWFESIENSAEWCVQHRQNGSRIPVVLIADAPHAALLLARYRSGFDDVVSPPMRLGGLMDRLQKVLLSSAVEHALATPLPLNLVGGKLILHPSEKILTTPAQHVLRLTEKETAVLLHLARSPVPVTRDELLHQVWGYQVGIETHTVETVIYRLRQKTASLYPDLIQTGSGGYFLAKE